MASAESVLFQVYTVRALPAILWVMGSFISLLRNFISVIGHFCALHCSLWYVPVLSKPLLWTLREPASLLQACDYSLSHTCLLCDSSRCTTLLFKSISPYVETTFSTDNYSYLTTAGFGTVLNVVLFRS